MKLTPAQTKQRLFDAMMRAGGDPHAAADFLGMSVRTFYRYREELGMGPVFEKMGWDRKTGPAKGTTHGAAALAQVLLGIIMDRGGSTAISDVGILAEAAFGEDTAKLRVQLYAAVSKLLRAGKIKISADDRFWVVVR